MESDPAKAVIADIDKVRSEEDDSNEEYDGNRCDKNEGAKEHQEDLLSARVAHTEASILELKEQMTAIWTRMHHMETNITFLTSSDSMKEEEDDEGEDEDIDYDNLFVINNSMDESILRHGSFYDPDGENDTGRERENDDHKNLLSRQVSTSAPPSLRTGSAKSDSIFDHIHARDNNNDINDENDEEDDHQTPLLPQDTFSFLALGGPLSLPFACALLVFAVQMCTFLIMVGWIDSQDEQDHNKVPLSLPKNVTVAVRFCQVFALVIATVSEDNVVASMETWSRGYHHASSIIAAAHPQQQHSAWSSRAFWHFSNLLRLLEGLMAIVAVFVFIMQADDGKQILLNFAAAQFVFLLDNVVFQLARSGFWGNGLIQKEACWVHKAKYADNSHTTSFSNKLLFRGMPFLVMIVAGLSLWFTSKQGHGEFPCQQLFVQLGDERMPGLEHFSGLYSLHRDGEMWRSHVEYHEVSHVGIVQDNDSNDEQTDALPPPTAKFGYSLQEGAWVFSHARDATTSLNLDDDWVIKSPKSASFDITDMAFETWTLKLMDSWDVPLDKFYLECFDCNTNDKLCGDHGTCDVETNQCHCQDGWFGLRCEFPTPCDTLVVGLESQNFPQLANPVRATMQWPEVYRTLGVTVYHRPVYVGTASYQYMGFADVETADVLIVFTGRYWEVVLSLDMGVSVNYISYQDYFVREPFHAYWSTHKPTFISGASDMDTASDAASPEGLSWFDASSAFDLGTTLVCRGRFTDGTLRSAIRQLKNAGGSVTTVEAVHGKLSEWDTGGVKDMSGLFGWKQHDAARSRVSYSDFFNPNHKESFFHEDYEYVIDPDVLSYYQHKEKAKKWGGHLASIPDMTVFDTLMEKVATFCRLHEEAWTNCSFWTGGRWQETFQWSDGTPWTLPENVWYNRTMKHRRRPVGLYVQAHSILHSLGGLSLDLEPFKRAIYKRFAGVNILVSPNLLSSWDTSQVTDTSGMFLGAMRFDGDISSWDTSKVVDMSNMFAFASTFNQALSGWDTSLVIRMSDMFLNAKSFNQDVSTWDTSSVINMASMFRGARSFRQELGSWKTQSVWLMDSMLEDAESFHATSLEDWNTSSVTSMSAMFRGATQFNGAIASWKVHSVTNMSYMFDQAVSFNQDLSLWNTTSVLDMRYMFQNSGLNQTLCWDLHPDVLLAGIFCRSSGNFDKSCVTEEQWQKSQGCPGSAVV